MNDEGRADAHLRLESHRSPVPIHNDRVADREPLARAPAHRFGGEERVEDSGANAGRDTGPGVRDAQLYLVSIAARGDRDRSLPGADIVHPVSPATARVA